MFLANSVERLRVAMFRARLSGSRQLGTLGLARDMLSSVAVGLLLLAGSVLVDAFVLPRLGVSASDVTSRRIAVVLTTVAGLNGLAALAVSTSVGPLTAALTRFPADVGVPLLEDNPRDGLLRLVVLNFVLALGLLSVRAVEIVVPLSGTALTIGLAVLTLAALLGYVKQRVALFYPTNLAFYLAQQMHSWLSSAASKPGRNPGRSVTAHLRRRYSANLERLVGICRSLLSENQEKEASEVLTTMSAVVANYAQYRRRIESDSEWFPIREVVVEGFDHSSSALYEQLALGPARRPKHDVHWFERKVGQAWGELLKESEEQGASAFGRAWVSSLANMGQVALEEQEFGLLDRLLEAAESATSRVEGSPILTELADLSLRLSESIQRQGLQTERANRFYQSTATLNERTILKASLPTVLTDTLVDLGNRLNNEVEIEGGVSVTPHAQAMSELNARLEQQEREVRERYLERAVTLLSQVLAEAGAKGASAALVTGCGTAFLIAERQLRYGNNQIAEAAATAGLEHVAEILGDGDVSNGDKFAVADRLRLLVVRCIAERRLQIVERAGPHLVGSLAGLVGFKAEALPDLLAVMTLGHVVAELDGEPRFREAMLSSIGDVPGFARKIKGASEQSPYGRYITIGDDTRYHHHFMPLMGEIRQLPERTVGGPGRGFNIEPDHESPFVRKLGRKGGLYTSFNEAVELFVESLIPPDEDETGTDG